MDVQRRQRQVVMAVEILHQPFRQVPRGVIVDINQRRDALARWCGVLRTLLQPGAGEIADDLGAVLDSRALPRAASISASRSSSIVMVIRCIPNFRPDAV